MEFDVGTTVSITNRNGFQKLPNEYVYLHYVVPQWVYACNNMLGNAYVVTFVCAAGLILADISAVDTLIPCVIYFDFVVLFYFFI